jgi:cytochrome c-type biogenesis protein CcmH/NrfG
MMSGAELPWWPAFATLGVASALGAWVARLLPAGAPRAPATSDTVADLEERLGHLVAQLRDLDEQRGRLSSAAYIDQKAEFEGRAAATLRALDETRRGKARGGPRARDAVEVTPAVQFLASRPQLRGALWGGGIVALGALLFTLVSQEQRPQAPMGGATGAATNPDQAEMKALYETLVHKPDDVAALTRMAHLLLKAQMHNEARVVNDRALQLDASSVEARTHAAVLEAGAGNAAAGQAGLDTVLKQDPTFAEAWFFKGMLAMQGGDSEVMRQSFQQFVRYAPAGPQRDRIRAMLERQATPEQQNPTPAPAQQPR